MVSSRVAAANVELEGSTVDQTSLSSIRKPGSRTRARSIDPNAKKGGINGGLEK
jgi:hypothetical protein